MQYSNVVINWDELGGQSAAIVTSEVTSKAFPRERQCLCTTLDDDKTWGQTLLDATGGVRGYTVAGEAVVCYPVLEGLSNIHGLTGSMLEDA